MKKLKISIEIQTNESETVIHNRVRNSMQVLAPLVASGANAEFAHMFVEEVKESMVASFNSNTNLLTFK